jgi:hypothetical protein
VVIELAIIDVDVDSHATDALFPYDLAKLRRELAQ